MTQSLSIEYYKAALIEEQEENQQLRERLNALALKNIRLEQTINRLNDTIEGALV